ncbi:class I SAM-dependent methyltransferase [Aurantivibrio plasticivorans]
MIDSKSFWDKIATRYANNPVRNEEVYEKKLSITQGYFKPDWKVFEFGCGTGSTAIVHAPHVGQFLASDISPNMIAIAEEKRIAAGLENLSFLEGTLESLALEPNSFDAVLGLNILHLLDNINETVASAYRLVKPGGIFVTSTALIGNINPIFRSFIKVMQWFGKAPFVNTFDKQILLAAMTGAGFTIDHEWQPGKDSIFIVARKPM